jgi:hypothetical protein
MRRRAQIGQRLTAKQHLLTLWGFPFSWAILQALQE